MTQTSATEDSNRRRTADALDTITRRTSHEVRNVLNAVAVNIEVVRSRLSREGVDLNELQAFADRASRESDIAASLTNGLADLTRLLARAITSQGSLTTTTPHSMCIKLQVPLDGSQETQISPDLRALTERLGIQVELDGPTVIFTVHD
jgi:signal transduction histidine kinase